MSTETKIVNGQVVQSEKKDKPLPDGTRYAEVRVRQFYTNDENGMVIMPTVVFFVKDGVLEPDMDLAKLNDKLMRDVNEQLPFPIRQLTEAEIAEELAKEVTVGSLTASQGKAALSVFAKNIPQEAANDDEQKAAA